MEQIVTTMKENPDRENIMNVWKDYPIEDAIVVIKKNYESHQAENNKFLLEKIVFRCCA